MSNSGDDGSGGGFWQNDDDGMDVGGRFTSTPGAEGLSGAMEQDFDPRRADGGGAADGGNNDGSGRIHPVGWEAKTRAQKHKYNQRRRK